MMQRLTRLWLVVVSTGIAVCYGSFLASRAAAQTSAGLQDLHHEAAFPEAIAPGKSRPYWDKEFLVSRVRETVNPGSPNVTLYDAEGRKASEASVWFPDSALVVVDDAAVAEGGRVVAAGYTARADGTAAHFVAETNLDGKVEHTVRTNPFAPIQVCAAPDGTVWSLGWELAKEDAGEDYLMLRNYSLNQGLLRAYLPRRELKGPIFRSVRAFLQCTNNSVAVYSDTHPEYFKVNLVDNTVEGWRVDASAMGDQSVTGFAVTDPGHIYASLDEHSDNEKGARLLTGLYELKPENKAGKLMRWYPVSGATGYLDLPGQARQGLFSYLYGTDGRNLIFQRTGSANLVWAAPGR